MNPEQPGGVPPQPSNEPAPAVPPVVPGQQFPAPGQPPAGQPVQFPAPPAEPHVDRTPYDFIMNPEKPGKVPLNPLGSSSKQRVMVLGGGAVLLIIVIVILSSLFKGGGLNAAPLITVAQEQSELVRVAAAGAQASSDDNTQAFAYSVQLSVTSDQQKLLSYLSSLHHTIKPEVLALKHSTDVDTQLANAQASNTYDATLRTVLQNDLSSYSQSLKAAYASNPGPRGDKILSDEFNAAQLLIQQSKQ